MPRREIPPVLVFDLDGTILRDNSFPLWAIHLIGGRLPGLQLRQRLILSLRSQSALLRRKLRRTSHAEFLRELQYAWLVATGPRSTMLAERFEHSLLRRVRPNLDATLAWLRTVRPDAILATAAAVEYVDGLGRKLGFHHIIATPSGRQNGEPCNSGTCKRDRVLQLLDERGWASRPLILFTDHPDDLPLIRESRTVYWFGTRALLSRMTEAAPNVSFIACCALDGETLCGMLRADCAGSGDDAADQLADPRAMTVS